MARPRKDQPLDLTQAMELTAGAIERLVCPPGKDQVFLRDSKSPGLRVRATASGAKSFVFEAKLDRKTIRRTIGDAKAWPIEEARVEANRLRVTLDKGHDPRELDRELEAVKAAKVAEGVANALTVQEAWDRYTKERKPHWGDRNYADHEKMTQEGGKAHKRHADVKTIAGPMASLMSMRLVDLDAAAIESWAAHEAKTRPARVRLALRLLKAFLRWAGGEADMKGKADPTAASAKKTREIAGKPQAKNDYLQREQLEAWFSKVKQIPNLTISVYLQVLLLTGARREELAALRWDDVNFQWKGMNMKDKIEGQRPVPLTPYVSSLLRSLPRRNEWVFSSQTSKSGRLAEPSIAHRKACTAAGLKLTLHGLRRSFASLCEWLDIPGGISAQIQGHAPQGVREQNYIRRPLDLLRVHHEKIEAWMLEQAKIRLDAFEVDRIKVVA